MVAKSTSQKRAQLESQIARLKMIEQKEEERRGHLPRSYPNLQAAASTEPRVLPEGFFVLTDSHYYIESSRLLAETKALGEIFDRLALLFGVSSEDVCLYNEGHVNRMGKQRKAYFFSMAYNPDLQSDLKECVGNGFPRFDRNTKSWNICDEDGVAQELFQNLVPDYFDVIIDYSHGHILASKRLAGDEPGSLRENQKKPPAQEPSFFEIFNDELKHAIETSRPGEGVGAYRISVHDGDKFVSLKPDSRLLVSAPYALFRYSLVDGKPRYLTIGTTDKAMMQIAFGNTSKRTSALIHDFKKLLLNHPEMKVIVKEAAAAIDETTTPST